MTALTRVCRAVTAPARLTVALLRVGVQALVAPRVVDAGWAQLNGKDEK